MKKLTANDMIHNLAEITTFITDNRNLISKEYYENTNKILNDIYDVLHIIELKK